MKLVPCAALASLLSMTGANATIALNGSLDIVAYSGIGDSVVVDPDSDSWALAPRTLNVSVAATNTYRASVLVVGGQGEAVWDSADAGRVLFQNYEWNLFSTDSMPPSYTTFSEPSDEPDWSYTFTATGSGRLVMDYDISVGPGDPFGLWGWDITFSGDGLGGPAPSAIDPTTSGTFVGFLENGATYTIRLNSRANISYGSTSFDYDGAPMQGLFNWSVMYDAPEPGSFFVIAAGFGLLVRRWRKPSAERARA